MSKPPQFPEFRTDDQAPSSPLGNCAYVCDDDYVTTYPRGAPARAGGTNNTAYVTSDDDDKPDRIAMTGAPRHNASTPGPSDVLDHVGLNQRAHEHDMSQMSEIVQDDDFAKHNKNEPESNGPSTNGAANSEGGES